MHQVEALYRDYGDLVLRRAERLLGSKEAAEDVLQEIFIKMVREPNMFRGESSPSTFFYRVTTNACFNKIRDKKNRKRLLKEKVMPVLEDRYQTNPVDGLFVKNVVPFLDEPQGVIVMYRYADGLELQEIADLLSISRRSVSNYLNRARDAIRSMLEEAPKEMSQKKAEYHAS